MRQQENIERHAAAWLMRQTEGLSDDAQAELDQWLDASAAHKTAFWRLEYAWEKTGRLAALRSADLKDVALADGRRSSVTRRWAPRWVMAIAATLVAAVLLTSIAVWPRPDVFSTETGGRRLVSLSDGSQVELNTDTRLRASMSATERETWLDQGEVYFDIAHDADRPFVVHVGDKTVSVLGTRFSVWRDGDKVRVVVAEGRVRLAARDEALAGPVVLERGDVAAGDGVSILRRRASEQRVEDELAWRRGLLVFDQVTLAQAVAEFNRYNQTKVEILDPETAATRIGGSFEAANVDAFVRLLQGAYGLHVDREPGRIIISG